MLEPTAEAGKQQPLPLSAPAHAPRFSGFICETY
jgi:hypothetical protein